MIEDLHDQLSKGNKSPTDEKKGSKKKGGLLPFNGLVDPLNHIVPKKVQSGDRYGKKC